MFCRKCGNEMPDYATRCDKCGTKVEGNSTAKGGFNKLLFIPIGAGAAAVIALVVALVFLLRPKDDIVQPSDSSVRTSSSSEIQAPVIIDNSPVTTPASTPSSNAADSNSQPNENKETIPGELTLTVNGDKLSVTEAGYCGALDMTDGENMNGLTLWGMNDKYVAVVMIGISHERTKANAVYYNIPAGGSGEKAMADIVIYDKQNDYMHFNYGSDNENEVKIGAFEPLKFINFSFAGTMNDDGAKFDLSLSGRFDYRTTNEVEDMSRRAMDAMKAPESSDPVQDPVSDPGQNTVNEVVIAGQSYSLDADYIDLTGKNVTNADIENLKYLTNLTTIQLSDNSRVTDLSALGGLTKLESLWLDDTGISDISPLSGCKNLREMGIKNTKVKDISALSNCTKLSKLIAVNCNISNISPLANCPDMRELWISENPITDFSPLVKLNNLETVGVNNCCEMTWSIMKTLYGLHFTKELNVSGNGLTEEMAIELNNNVYSSSGQLWY